MPRFRVCHILQIAVALLCVLVLCPSAFAQERLGVVLLHDKNGSPAKNEGDLERQLRNVGLQVIAPELPWSKRRGFDATYQQALVEIGMAAQELRLGGCTRVALVGHGLGANAALGFAASRTGVFAIVALAPSHDPDQHREVFLPDVRKARTMLDEGEGRRRSLFMDFNMDRDYDLSTTAEVYLSFNDPDGEAVMPRSCAKLIGHPPLLWVVGARDPLSHLGRYYAFSKAPENPMSRYEEVSADHMGVPSASARLVAQWLLDLMRTLPPDAPASAAP
jgi:acetyl esterase/lipase